MALIWSGFTPVRWRSWSPGALHAGSGDGIDAPCCWSRDGRVRPSERQLMADGISCFTSPTHEAALCHPRNYYDWKRNGKALFHALEPTHLLCVILPLIKGSRCCFETFPQAIACALGRPHPSGQGQTPPPV